MSFLESSIALKLMNFLLAFEAGLSKPFFPRVKIDSENRDLVVSYYKQFFCDVSQDATVHFIFIELGLQSLQSRSDSLHFIYRLFVYWGY